MVTTHTQMRSFLPDFCTVRTLFTTMLTAELLALAITLSGAESTLVQFSRFGLISLFTQWLALWCLLILCNLRAWLVRQPDPLAGVSCYAIILLVIWLMSELAWWLSGIFHVTDNVQFSRADFLLRTLVISTLLAAFVLRYLYIQHHWRLRVESESQARIQALQARIRPHFLFNCMNTIASLTRSQPAAAEKAVEDLADLFRASLNETRTLVRISEELALCKQYCDIEALRLGARLKVEWHVDGLPPQALIPSLTIQPLLENAVYHGIEPLAGGGKIHVTGVRLGDQCEISVRNPLPPHNPNAPRGSGHHLALDNIRARLHTLYGQRAGLQIDPLAGDEYRVTLRWPLQTQIAGA